MELGETFEELLKTVDDVADWLQEKGFSSDIIDAFKGMGHDLVEVLVSAVYMWGNGDILNRVIWNITISATSAFSVHLLPYSKIFLQFVCGVLT